MRGWCLDSPDRNVPGQYTLEAEEIALAIARQDDLGWTPPKRLSPSRARTPHTQAVMRKIARFMSRLSPREGEKQVPRSLVDKI